MLGEKMSDDEEIKTLVGEHFEPMRWGDGADPDWDKFQEDFIEGAVLCGAARPAQSRSVESFVERMEKVARKNLHSFEEHTRDMKIMRFGNIAVVLAMSELLENRSETSHDISGYLLVKSEGRWSILGHAWDQASDGNPAPEFLRAGLTNRPA